MFELAIPLLIVIILLIGVLEYLELLDLVSGFVALMVAGIVGIVKLTIRLVRYCVGAKPSSKGPSPSRGLFSSEPRSPERGPRANRGRWGGSRRQP